MCCRHEQVEIGCALLEVARDVCDISAFDLESHIRGCEERRLFVGLFWRIGAFGSP